MIENSSGGDFSGLLGLSSTFIQYISRRKGRGAEEVHACMHALRLAFVLIKQFVKMWSKFKDSAASSLNPCREPFLHFSSTWTPPPVLPKKAEEAMEFLPTNSNSADHHEGHSNCITNKDDTIERLTKDGSLDCYGQPAERGKSGGWSSGLLLLANQGLATLAFVGVEVNLVLFSTRVLKQANADASNTFSRWMGTVNLFSLFGAFLSDAYLGSYKTCAIFQSLLAAGLVMLSLTTSYLLIKPLGCGKAELPCDPHTPFEMAMFYFSLYLVALGNGAAEPSVATLGSGQFDEEDEREKAAKKSFYSYFYVASNLGSLFSETVLAYLQNLGHWTLGFWVSAASALLGGVVLLSGTSRYRHFKCCGNPIARFSQVLAAAWKKSATEILSQEDGLYEVKGTNGSVHGGRRILRTKEFKFLDRAAIITTKDASGSTPHNPWRLCTVTQVEEAKCVLRLIPIWLCTITFIGIFVQMVSLFVEQGASMRTTFCNFRIPPASMTVFDILSVAIFIIFYDKLIAPLYTKLTNTVPKGPSDLKKMEYGLPLAILGMLAAGFLEIQRKKYMKEGDGELSSLSILWQIPQYVLLGVGEALVFVSQMDFFGSQVPDVMRSLGIGLSLFANSVGSYLCSFILSLVMKVTTKNGQQGWVPPNLNDGLLERYFFLMSALAVVELVVFAWVAGRYKGISVERRKDMGSEDTVNP